MRETEISKLTKAKSKLESRGELSGEQKSRLKTITDRLEKITPRKTLAKKISEKLTNTEKKD